MNLAGQWILMGPETQEEWVKDNTFFGNITCVYGDKLRLNLHVYNLKTI